MFKKTLISEFFTTINFKIFLNTLGLLTYKLPILRYGKYDKIFEVELLSYLGLKKSKIISFYNGRSALYHCLKIIGIKKNDEILVNGYTCISVSNAIIQTGGKIIYSDIDNENLGFDIGKLEKNISSKTKAIIVQHTFGKPSNIEKIKKITDKNNIILIEDCAHSLGSKIGKNKIGTYGDFSIFSTGRDKVISSVTGGFLILNNKIFFDKIKNIKKSLKNPSILLTVRNLLYNILGYISYLLYDFFKIGRFIIFFSRKLLLITEILSNDEKKCRYNEFNYKLPNSLFFLAIKELERIKMYRVHRCLISEYYNKTINNTLIKKIFKNNKNEKNNYFRYPILLKNEIIKNKFYYYMKKNGILLGNTWSGINIVPKGTSIKNSLYISGGCSVAEDISNRILTLPNHYLININDAASIIKLINNFDI